jgi:predicted glutamine amidotransferase
MSCRMFVAVGQFRMSQLVEDFKLMAQNKNEKHEYNEKNQNFIHDNGWGIVLGRSGQLEHYKKAVACWKDQKFSEYGNIQADLVVLHARRASPGSPINYSYTHPFHKDCWYFCHNGTIYDFSARALSAIFSEITSNKD